MPAEITDQAHLEQLPDGTIISWRRIPGDPTSQAVAFVCVQAEWTPASDPERDGTTERIVWISPGGWQPMTIDDAGITYPVTVITPCGTDDYQEKFDAIQYQAMSAWPTKPEDEFALMTMQMADSKGGTWAREKALECATQWTLSDLNSPGGVPDVLAIAEQFEAWLDRDPSADDVPEIDQAPSLGELAEQLTRLKVVGVTRAALMYAVDHVWHEETDQ